MPLVTVAITLLVVGVLLWLVNPYIPMQESIKGILNAVVVIEQLRNTRGLLERSEGRLFLPPQRRRPVAGDPGHEKAT